MSDDNDTTTTDKPKRRGPLPIADKLRAMREQQANKVKKMRASGDKQKRELDAYIAQLRAAEQELQRLDNACGQAGS